MADAIVFQRQYIFKGPLPLPLQHDLVRFAPDVGADEFFEIACFDLFAWLVTDHISRVLRIGV